MKFSITGMLELIVVRASSALSLETIQNESIKFNLIINEKSNSVSCSFLTLDIYFKNVIFYMFMFLLIQIIFIHK